MGFQLGLLDDDGHCERDELGASLPETVRRDVCERFADLLIAVVRSASEKELPNDLDEDHAEASGS